MARGGAAARDMLPGVARGGPWWGLAMIGGRRAAVRLCLLAAGVWTLVATVASVDGGDAEETQVLFAATVLLLAGLPMVQ